MDSRVETRIEFWAIGKFVPYARNPRKNDGAIDRMCASLREFGFKIPILARSDGEVVDGHLRLKAANKLGSWPGGDTSQIPVITCDDWTPQQVKAFRLMVNRSVTWADWDEELLALELQELNAADFDLDLTGFNPGEIDGLLALPDEEIANATPAVPENPVSRAGDLWLCGKHRVLCGDCTRSEDVSRLLGDRKPILMAIIWDKGRTILTRTLYWFQHEPCWFVRKKNAPWFGKAGENSTIWAAASPKFIMGGSDEDKFDHPTQKPVELMRRPILNHLKRGELVYEPFLGSGTTLAAAQLTERVCCGIELDPKYVDVIVQRWETLSGNKAKLDGDGRTFEEIAVERRKEPA